MTKLLSSIFILEAGVGGPGVEVLSRGANEKYEVSAANLSDRQASDLSQQTDHGRVSRADAEVLLDPSKYDTCLEQLGIKYPTTR